MITAESFKEATGNEPQQDDLERCNCERAGELFHRACGWCQTHNLPKFQCACFRDPYGWDFSRASDAAQQRTSEEK